MSHRPLETAARSLRFLIVEDQRLVARDLQNCLESLDHIVVGRVTTGEAAVTQARALHPSLITMDIRLEGEMDGITAAQQIWCELQIPSLFTTGHSDQTTLARAMSSTGMFGYILKPFSEKALDSAIQTALRHGQPIGMGLEQDTTLSQSHAVESQILLALTHFG